MEIERRPRENRLPGRDIGGVFMGFVLGVVLQVLCTAVFSMLPGLLDIISGGLIDIGDDDYMWPMAFIGFAGVTQLIYMGPAFYFAKRDGASKGFLKGLILAAVLLFILNAGCWGQLHWE